MSGYHQSRFAYDPRRDAIWGAIVAYLLRTNVIRPNWDVADIGAGYCHWINNVTGGRRYAIDVFPELPRYAEAGVTAAVQRCDEPWPIDAASLDAVLASNVLEHLTRDELDRTVAQAGRALKPGGRFVVIQPNYRYAYREYYDDYTHVAVFSHRSLPDYFLSQGFGILRVEPRLMPYSMKAAAPKNRWLVDLYLRSPIRPFAKQMLVVAEKPR